VKGGFIYILSGNSGVFYTCVTSRLEARVASHRRKIIEGLTKKYSVTRLVYYESFGDIRAASVREKQMKSWLRAKKSRRSSLLILIWKDLLEDFYSHMEDCSNGTSPFVVTEPPNRHFEPGGRPCSRTIPLRLSVE
jgi:putative endonuclease